MTFIINDISRCNLHVQASTKRAQHPFKSYLLSGRLLHIITLAEILLLLLLLSHYTDTFTVSLHERSAWEILVFYTLWLYPVSAQFDARSRFQNYKKIKDQIYLFGFQKRIVKPILKSRCQRDAAMVAATELGYGRSCREFFRRKGYRWYHLLPDFIFTNPLFLLSKYFWLSTFFVPTYKPRIHFIGSQAKVIG